MLARLAADHGVAGVPLLLNASGETATTLPWSGIDEITIRFSEDVLVPPDALKLSGVNVPEYAIASFVFDTTTDTGTWKLATPIDADKLLLTLDDSVTDLIELPLDGDATGSANSGNGSAGGDLQVRFNVLLGDVTASGSVGLEDISAIVAGAFRISTDLDYQASRDLNGDGRINMVDTVLANNRGGSALPGGEPVSAGSPAAASSIAASSVVRATRRSAVEEPTDDRAVARARQAVRRAVDEAFAAAESNTEHLSTLGSDRGERTLRRSVRTR
jgi:hypothetical protein